MSASEASALYIGLASMIGTSLATVTITFAITAWIAFGSHKHRTRELRTELAEVRARLERVSPQQARIGLSITSPKADTHVDREITVEGFVEPLGTPVQVFVLSGNGLWHPQGMATFTPRNTWEARCWLGDPGAPPGAIYQIAAVAGMKHIEGPIDILPVDAARSDRITLFRR